LEKYAWGKLKGEEILSQGLTKEMEAVMEALRQDSPGELARGVYI
jgi:hypothetical protein